MFQVWRAARGGGRLSVSAQSNESACNTTQGVTHPMFTTPQPRSCPETEAIKAPYSLPHLITLTSGQISRGGGSPAGRGQHHYGGLGGEAARGYRGGSAGNGAPRSAGGHQGAGPSFADC